MQKNSLQKALSKGKTIIGGYDLDHMITAPMSSDHQDETCEIQKEMPNQPARHSNKLKVLIAMFFGVVFGAIGNISLSKGMKIIADCEYECASDAILAAVTHPYIIGGIVLLTAFLLLYLASLSWEDLSYVLPLTAGDYVLVTLLAYFILHEDVTPLRWAGSLLVATGIALVARS